MGWTIALLLGVSLLTLVVFLAVRQHMWLRKARVADGTVVELIGQRGDKGSHDLQTTRGIRRGRRFAP